MDHYNFLASIGGDLELDESTFADTLLNIAQGISADSKEAIGMVMNSIDTLPLFLGGYLGQQSVNNTGPCDLDELLRIAQESTIADIQSR